MLLYMKWNNFFAFYLLLYFSVLPIGCIGPETPGLTQLQTPCQETVETKLRYPTSMTTP